MKPKYRTILADPPWPEKMLGSCLRTRKFRPAKLVYPTMSVEEIEGMPIRELADKGCHLWLWTTQSFLHAGFHVMESWGAKYHATIVWTKPSGTGNYFISRNEFLLFGYFGKCIFNKSRFIPNIYHWPPTGKHSKKPEGSFNLIESISDEPRLELFARPITPLFPKRDNWDVWGNEVDSRKIFDE